MIICNKISSIKKKYNFLKNLFSQFSDCLFSSESASIAFTSMFAVIPCSAIIIFGSQLFTGNQGHLTELLLNLFKIDSINFEIAIQNYLSKLTGNGVPHLIIAFVLFYISITGVYCEIEKFFNKIWETTDNKSFIEKRLNKKAGYAILIFIILFGLFSTLTILNPGFEYLDYLIISLGFLLFCWITLYLAYRYIPKEKPTNEVAGKISFAISILILITLLISSIPSIKSIISDQKIYGTDLFLYLIMYRVIWAEILAGCRLTFELEMGFSDYMGEKRLNWKDMSYQRKEALCWYVYNKIENNDNAIKDDPKDTYKIDPKILLWALRKLSDLDLIDLNDEKSSIKGTKKEIKDFHDYFYTSGKHLVENVELNDDYKEALLNVENILKEGLKEINGNKQEKIEPVKLSLTERFNSWLKNKLRL